MIFCFYSVRSATTGSFFAALLEGIIPANNVRSTLIAISIKPTLKGKCALKLDMPVSECIIAFIGMHNK